MNGRDTGMIWTVSWKAAQEGAGMHGKLIKGWERLVGINKGGVAKEREKNKTKSKTFLFGFFLLWKQTQQVLLGCEMRASSFSTNTIKLFLHLHDDSNFILCSAVWRSRPGGHSKCYHILQEREKSRKISGRYWHAQGCRPCHGSLSRQYS